MDITPISPAGPEPDARGTGAPKGPAGADLPAACRSFEAYFTSCLLSSMTKTLDVSRAGGREGQEAQWVWGLLTRTVADEMAEKQSLGLGRQLQAYCAEKMEIQPPRPAPAEAGRVVGKQGKLKP